MKIAILSTLLYIVCEFTISAQSDFRTGFLIKNNNDSLPGLISYRKASASYDFCFFKETKGSPEQKLAPDDLKGYGYLDDRRYETKTLKRESTSKKVFAEVLVKGKASLYLNGVTFYFEKDSLVELPINKRIVVEGEDWNFTRESKKYVGILNLQIADCKLNANEVQYNQRNLTQLVQKYNQCKGSKGIVYKKNLPFTKLNTQLFAGFSTTNLKVDGFADDVFKSSQTIVGGGSFDISSPRLNSKFFFSIEGWYVKNLYQGYAEGQQSGYQLREDVVIDVSYLKIPFGLRFNFRKDNQTPYIKFGIVKYYELKSSLKKIDERESNAVVNTSLAQQSLDSRNLNGFWLAVGYTKSLSGPLKAFTELRYENTVGSIYSPLIDSKMSMTNLNVLLGLRF